MESGNSAATSSGPSGAASAVVLFKNLLELGEKYRRMNQYK